MQTLFRIKSYINHWLDAVDEHSVHSPFFFDFYNKVIHKKKKIDFSDIEKMRRNLLKNDTIVHIKDLGAKSLHFKNNERSISKIAATSLSERNQCELLYHIATYFDAKNILELGTSMGITSLYLSMIEKSKVTTFEGNAAMINIALTNFEYFDKKNIELIEGTIDETLQDYLQNPAKIDFALIDANHRYESTLRYFDWLSKRMSNRGVIVIDDIYYSKEMTHAWNVLKKHNLVYGSVDLYKCGILFFDLTLNKQHFVWSYK